MPVPTRDELVSRYLDELPYEPYPVQEEALLAWFTSEEGVLVCAPTGTGKTVIAQAALFEALHTGKVAYYTTPLIALTDQKFQEMQDSAVQWGFKAEDVGLVTGNRKVNPDAKVLVVVAEILLNRLLNPEAFDFANVAAVVMDEFHSFNDPERGIVWELSLGLLPKHIRLLLLSATVGNTADFLIWMRQSLGRRLDLVQSTDRKVPLQYHWIADELLNEQLEFMASGDEASRRTPLLLFCFNREECWTVAEQLRGKDLLSDGQQKVLAGELAKHDWSQGIGPKLKTMLMRGIGVHHAGVLPKYKRIVEDLFQRKLLTVCVCTETLSAGMNLPARSVLLTTLLKGPPGKKTLIDPSVAHQIFGRAGRPQFDTEGHVYALAHEDDVRIHRFKQKLEQIPEDTKDPLLIRKRKELKKKMPTRRKTEQYWNEEQFNRLIAAPPAKLQSQGELPWRLLAYLLSISPAVAPVQQAVRRRLMDSRQIARGQRHLIEQLVTLDAAGCVTLTPPPAREVREPLCFDVDGTQVPLLDRITAAAAEGRFGDVQTWSPRQIAVDESAGRDGTGESLDGDAEFAEADDFGAGLLDDSSAPSMAAAAARTIVPEQMTHSLHAEPEPETPASDVDQTSGNTVATGSGLNDREDDPGRNHAQNAEPAAERFVAEEPAVAAPAKLTGTLKFLLQVQGVQVGGASGSGKAAGPKLVRPDEPEEIPYEPERAEPTAKLASLLTFKSINPLYGHFLLEVLPHCDWAERIQALESVLEFPASLSKALRIPRPQMLPPSLFTLGFLHTELLQRGVASPAELALELPPRDDQEPPEERVWPLTFPEKLMRLFHSEYPGINDTPLLPVWAAGELLHFGGDFNKLITSRKIAKQEGLVFRHVLRFVLLCEEFLQHLPDDHFWRHELLEISDRLTDACREVDPHSTDQMIESARAGDVVSAL